MLKNLILIYRDSAATDGYIAIFEKVDPDGAVIEFAEKRTDGDANWINAGIYLLSRQVLLSIPEDQPASLEYDVFPTLVGRGLYGCKSDGRFLDIGTPDDFASAAGFFAISE